MTLKKIKNFFLFLIIFFIFDYFLTLFFISKFNFYEKLYPQQNHRISNINYHHSFKKNADTYDYWGEYKYKFFTNSIGFKDKLNRNITNKTNLKKRIIIIGDSFIEGIGYKYEETFVGLLDKQMENKNIEILNAGVASQSPIIYYKKIKYLIDQKNLFLDELVVFLDISDIPDEYYYNKNFDINDSKKFNIRNYLQEFLIKNISSYLFLDIISSRVNNLKENIILRSKASKEFKISFLDTTKDKMNLFKSIKVERGNWMQETKQWNTKTKKGRELAELYLNKLLLLCIKNNIKFNLVIYPWPNQIFFKYDYLLHREFWKNWSISKKVKFIDLFYYFENDIPENIINNYFIPGDIHWNKFGHSYIFDIMMDEYFKDL